MKVMKQNVNWLKIVQPSEYLHVRHMHHACIQILTTTETITTTTTTPNTATEHRQTKKTIFRITDKQRYTQNGIKQHRNDGPK